MHLLDFGIIGSYFLICITLGLTKSKLVKNIKDYTLGRSHFSTAVLVSTIFATSISSSSSIGKIENIYKYGLIYAVPSLFIFIYWLITAKLFARVIDRFRNCLSLNEIMQNVYGKPGLVLTNCSTLIDSIGFITIQFVGIGSLLSYFFGVPYLVGVLIAFFIIALYSFFGGIRAVLITDVFQFAIFFIAFPIAGSFLYRDVGGYEGIKTVINNNYKSIYFDRSNIWLFFSYLFYCLLPTVSAPNIQRMLIAKNKKQIIHSLYIVAALVLVFNFIIVVISLSIKVEIQDSGAETVFYYFIKNYLTFPHGIIGAMIAGILSVMMSTADSWLNVASSTVAHDVCKKVFPNISVNCELNIARASTIVLASIACIIAVNIPKILEIIWFTRNFMQPVIFIPFVACIFNFKTDKRSFISGAIMGIVGVALARYFTKNFGLISLMVGTLTNSLGFFGFHFFFIKKQQMNIAEAFALLKIKILYLYKHLKKEISQSILLRGNAETLRYFYFFIFLITGTNVFSIMFFPSFSGSKDFLFIIRIFVCSFGVAIFFLGDFVKKPRLSKISFVYLAISILLTSILYCFSKLSIIGVGNFLISFILFSLITNTYKAITWSILCFLMILTINFYDQTYFNYSVNHNEIVKYSFVATCILFLLFFIERYRQNKMQKSLNEVLVGTVIHDLRNPMSLIRNYIYLLKSYNVKDSKIKRVVKKIEGEIDNSAELVDSFLFNMKNSAAQRLTIFKIDILVQDVIKSQFFKKFKSSISLNIQTPYLIKANEFLFKQVLINLLKNSIEATRNSHKKFISINIYTCGNKGYLSIKDTGIGIKEEEIGVIFDPLFSTKKNGIGIGLAFCKNILNKMGAEIECKSEYGKYSEFKIIFDINI